MPLTTGLTLKNTEDQPLRRQIQGQLQRGELVTVLDDFALPAYDILAVYPQQRHVPAKVRFFVQHLKGVYAQAGYWD